MIPKIIHYCWFGEDKKPLEVLDCIASWEKHCPDFVIKEWNELTFSLEHSPYARKMYSEKNWSGISDYARLQILHNEGGFYLEPNLFLLKSLLPLITNTCVLAEEKTGVIGGGIQGAVSQHPFIEKCIALYDTTPDTKPAISQVLVDAYESYDRKKQILLCPPVAFYPYDHEHIQDYRGQPLGADVYGVYLWRHFWGHRFIVFCKKIGLDNLGKKIITFFGL